MHYPALIKAQHLIQSGDIAGAEAALVALADEEGDQALVLALDSFPSKDLLTVIREYDTSKESVLNLLITPEQFARAVVIEKQYKDLSHTHLRGMMNSVLFREDANTVEFLATIGELDGGCDALADYLIEHWARVESFVRTGTFDPSEDDGTLMPEASMIHMAGNKPRVELDEVTDNDWMQFTYLLRTECPDLFIEVLITLRARYAAYHAELAAEDAEGDEDDGPFLHEIESESERMEKKSKAVDLDEESAI